MMLDFYNDFIESFNGKFQAACLNARWFMSLDDARRKCDAWRTIGNKGPIDRLRADGPP
jgi:putative transposase